jgi:SAM-dependent methyltransferase
MTISQSSQAPIVEAQHFFNEGRLEAALDASWKALAVDPDSVGAKSLLAKLLQRVPTAVDSSREKDLLRLLRDPDVDPAQVSKAGWHLVSTAIGTVRDPLALATALERNRFAQALLEETYVAWPDAERLLTPVRRWLLIERLWPRFPRLAAALIAQAHHNGGAWLFNSEEEERLKEAAEFRSAYFPAHEAELRIGTGENPVARQYETWPFPQWNRVTRPVPTTLPHVVNRLDPGSGGELPLKAKLLVAGCGTGREAAMAALRYPDAHVTAIDISMTSLDYAREKCRDLPIEFQQLDLREVHRRGKSFDAIFCSGVLHHIPDPEAAWRTLVDVLRPGGVMRVALYSRIGRLKIAAAKKMIADLICEPHDDRLLRTIRRRLLEAAPGLLADAFDFYTLAGVHDMLLNRHEDPFDMPRIGRALNMLGLRLLTMNFPVAVAEAQYRKDHPQDPHLRDLDTIGAFEQRNPFLFRSMYNFWCRKPCL